MKPSGTPPAARPPPATIHDVAAAAGVSLGTVSKGLNGTGQLREETRQRVHQAAKRLNFRPNNLAQSLLRGRSFTIGLISTDRYGRFSIPVLEGVEDALENARVSVFLCNGADDPDREREHVEQLLDEARGRHHRHSPPRRSAAAAQASRALRPGALRVRASAACESALPLAGRLGRGPARRGTPDRERSKADWAYYRPRWTSRRCGIAAPG